MTNQSELGKMVYDHLSEVARIGSNPCTDSHIDDLERFITANYTLTSEVEQLKSRIAWLEGKIEGLSNDNLTPHLTPHLTPKKLPRFEP